MDAYGPSRTGVFSAVVHRSKRTAVVAALCLVLLVVSGCSSSSGDGASPTTDAERSASSTTSSSSSSTSTSTTTTTLPEATIRAEVAKEVERACAEARLYDERPKTDFDQRWAGSWNTAESVQQAAQRCLDEGSGAEVQGEIQRACDAARGSDDPPAVEFKQRWEWIGQSESAMNEAAAGCVDAADEAAANGAPPVDVDQMIKNPDAYKGQYFVLVSEITQFDGATGQCAFRGYWDNTMREYNFEYAGDNAFFTSGDGLSNCPALANVDQNDVVRLWVRGTGAYSYDTQVGGNTTAPSFKVIRAQVIEKR